jgi:hypothetical protein
MVREIDSAGPESTLRTHALLCVRARARVQDLVHHPFWIFDFLVCSLCPCLYSVVREQHVWDMVWDQPMQWHRTLGDFL